jgi:YgiT-type zinc finger domain-containing protein
MTTCYFCKGRIEPARVDYMYNAAGRYALVRGLPVERCAQCGALFLADRLDEHDLCLFCAKPPRNENSPDAAATFRTETIP